MPQLSAGQTASIILAPADSYTVSASATTTVKGIYGAPSTTTTLTANFQTFGPYSVPAKMDISCASGTATYSLIGSTLPANWADEAGTALRTPAGGSVAVGGGISSKYKFFIPGQQFIGSGNAKDRSGNAADGTLLASLPDASAWANPGYLSTVAGTNGQISIPVSKFSFDLATQSVIFSCRIKKVGPVAAEAIFGCGDTASALGFYVSMRSASGSVSKIRPVLNTTGGVVSGLADSLATFGEATLIDHVVTLMIDGITKSVFLYCDGTLSNTYAAAFTGGTPTITNSFGIGGQFGNVGSASVIGQFSGIHMLAMNGSLPTNMSLVAQKLAATPHMWLSDADLVF